MTTHKEVLTLVLEALEDNQHLVADNERHSYVMEYNDLIEKCKEALAQPEQEEKLPPVEIGVDVTKEGTAVTAFYRRPNSVMEMFYSQFHPAPQRTWVGLSQEDFIYFCSYVRSDVLSEIEAKLKELNT